MNPELAKTLWDAADKMRSNMDAAEYKHIVLGLIFLKYVSDSFDERLREVKTIVADPSSDYYVGSDAADQQGALEDRDYYTSANVFWVPASARWEAIRNQAKQADIGRIIDDALIAIEHENPSLKGILDKRFARSQLEPGKLGELIDQISKIGFGAKEKAIFKSWFVDFDPVKAKAEGREPEGMDGSTVALFPSEFEESELGMIPKGSRVGTATAIMELGRRTINPGNSPETQYEHYSLPAFDAGQMSVMDFGETIKSNKTVVSSEAVLLSKLNPHIPRIWLPNVQNSDVAISSTEFLVIVPKGDAFREYLYAMFISDDFIGRFQQLVTGTSNSHQRIKPSDLLEMKLVIPPPAILSTFTDAVSSQFRSIANNRLQSQTLATLRDTLLPRLMSGQLRVPEAELMVEGAA